MATPIKVARLIQENWPLISGVGKRVIAIGAMYGYNREWLRDFLRQHHEPTRESDTMRDIQAHDDQEYGATIREGSHKTVQELEQLLEVLKQKLHELQRKQEELELRGKYEALEGLQRSLFGMQMGVERMDGEVLQNEGHSGTEEGKEIVEGKGELKGALRLRQERENSEAEKVKTEVQRRVEEERVADGRRRQDEESAEAQKIKEEAQRRVEERIAGEKRRQEEVQRVEEEMIAGEKRRQQEASRLRQEEAERSMIEQKIAEEEKRKIEKETRKIEKEREAIERTLQQKKRGFEDWTVCEEEQRRHKHNRRNLTSGGCVQGKEGEKVGKEAVEVEERGQLVEGRTQPVVWPSSEEIQSAKERVQYSPDKFAFAVAGASGSGKSTLINVFLNSNTAPTGIVETTAEVGRYPDPGNQPPQKGTVWYDIPGAGTLNVPGWQYFNSQGLFVFDLIIVMVGDRFTQVDFDILENCRRYNIPSFIVRSKADQHIRNMMRESGYDSDCGRDENLRQRCRTEFIKKTRDNIDTQLKDRHVPPQKIYIVSSSKEFKRLYSSLNINSGIQEEMDAIDKNGRFIDELEFIFDILTMSRARRCDTAEEDSALVQQKATTHQKPPTEPPISTKKVEKQKNNTNALRTHRPEESLLSRLRTGHVNTGSYLHRNGKRNHPGCHCGAKIQDVEHILLKCPSLTETRNVSSKKLGRSKMTMTFLLYTEEGNKEAVMIWSAFVGTRDIYEPGETYI